MKNNNNHPGSLIEQLCCVALGGAVMIALGSASTCFYKYATHAHQQQQEQQQETYDKYDYILMGVNNYET